MVEEKEGDYGKQVYFFGEGKNEGSKDMKPLLGGKGANLAEMSNVGVPVPPGFTISTEVCDIYYKNNQQYPQEILDQIYEKLQELEQTMGKNLGDSEDPLLVSVRSGAAISMPGMMDTVLNLGLNDESVEGLSTKTDNPRFAWDSYRRFIQMFSDVVMGIDIQKFEDALEEAKKEKGVENDTELDVDDLKSLVEKFKEIFKNETGEDFPQSPRDQLQKAIDAVFGSWNNERAISYRKMNNITGLKGTAVTVQSMVFGNTGENSGTGVAFSRNPSTGENELYGEFLMNAQGEDVVAGIRTPQAVSELKDVMPEVYEKLKNTSRKLEAHYKNMQDMEFTIQEGELYFLQTRNGKKTAKAAVNIAVDMVNEELISREDAIQAVDPESLDQLLHKQVSKESKEKSTLVGKGLPASPGAAVGKVVFTADAAKDQAEKGEDVVLVRKETSPDDIEGMHSAKGVVTSRGGMTSHAAVVARGMGKCCVAGCSDLTVSEHDKVIEVSSEGGETKSFHEGDTITVDGSTGEVYEGSLELEEPEMSGNFLEVMKWADEARKLKVRTNADNPEDAKKALEYGAEGIGLCRTEHMFFQEDRIKAMREMILSETQEGRKKALEKIQPMQKSDFKGIFKEMGDKPVTIRLLDPPLHEFLPSQDSEIKELAESMEMSEDKVKETIDGLHETNPMLGHRGCRLGITYPEITEMQTRAIIEAAAELSQESGEGTEVKPEIMVPLVGNVKEFENQKSVIQETANAVLEEKGLSSEDVKYKIGTMIEVPRAAVTADRIAEQAEFFSFGTNDLTQMGCGFSRDDSGKFLNEYVDKSIYDRDPFQSLDQDGVGELIRISKDKGRSSNESIKLGICGEHGGDPASIEFCNNTELDYVSCSPFRVPIARLAAAQAAVKDKEN